MKIVLDVMGGDNPAAEFVKGAVMAKKKYGVEITLVGDENQIRDALASCGGGADNFEIVNACDVVTMEDDPMSITKEHSESSMATALKLVAGGEGDAVVSAGNTGALFTGATLIEKRIRGVRRAALATVIPFQNPILLLDCGANVTVTPEYLVQFAYLGSIYMECVLGVESPRVALLNNGTEAHKGTPTIVEAYNLLKDAEGLNFIGNVEGKTVPFDACDVVVADGFTGNIFLKTSEGTSKFVIHNLKEGILKGVGGLIAALLKGKSLKKLVKRFDAKEYGGAPFLGLAKPVIKAHGDSDAKAICAAVGMAAKYSETGVVEKIAACSDKFPKKALAEKTAK